MFSEFSIHKKSESIRTLHVASFSKDEQHSRQLADTFLSQLWDMVIRWSWNWGSSHLLIYHIYSWCKCTFCFEFWNLPSFSKVGLKADTMTKHIWSFQISFLGLRPLSNAWKISLTTGKVCSFCFSLIYSLRLILLRNNYGFITILVQIYRSLSFFGKIYMPNFIYR